MGVSASAYRARRTRTPVWLSDFTYIHAWEGWGYLVVGWNFASRMRQSLVTDALEMAIATRREHANGTIARSDDGSQYTSYEYTERPKTVGQLVWATNRATIPWRRPIISNRDSWATR